MSVTHAHPGHSCWYHRKTIPFLVPLELFYHSLLILVHHLIHLSLAVICLHQPLLACWWPPCPPHHFTLPRPLKAQPARNGLCLKVLAWLSTESIWDFDSAISPQTFFMQTTFLKTNDHPSLKMKTTNIYNSAQNRTMKANLAWTHEVFSLVLCRQIQGEATPADWAYQHFPNHNFHN